MSGGEEILLLSLPGLNEGDRESALRNRNPISNYATPIYGGFPPNLPRCGGGQIQIWILPKQCRTPCKGNLFVC